MATYEIRWIDAGRAAERLVVDGMSARDGDRGATVAYEFWRYEPVPAPASDLLSPLPRVVLAVNAAVIESIRLLEPAELQS